MKMVLPVPESTHQSFQPSAQGGGPWLFRLRSFSRVIVSAIAVLFIVATVAYSLSLVESALAQSVTDKIRGMVHGVFGVEVAEAAPLHGYEALQVLSSGSGRLTIKPGETKQFMIQFQNIGTKTWTNNGDEFVSIYTYDPKYRSSVFRDASWFQGIQPAKLKETSVAPGQVGHILVNLKAPTTAGTYKETFHLAAEDRAWIPGGKFTVDVVVSDSTTSYTAPAPTTTPTTSTTSGTAEGLGALLLLRSARRVEARGGDIVSYTVGVKNTGTKAWTRREIRTPAVVAAFDSGTTRDASWLSSNQLVANTSGVVQPGQLDFLTFSFKAPSQVGNYTVRYTLAADGVVVPGFAIDIPVDVTSNAPQVIQAPVEQEIGDFSPKMQEPNLRVAFLIVDEETNWEVDISCAVPWALQNGSGATIANMPANVAVNAYYKDGKYWYNTGSGIQSSADYLRFVPSVKNEICTVENFDRRVTRGFRHADNTFRNILEMRYNSSKDRTWIINELPMEMYLRGLAETSNVSHEEFQKVLITVARTYGLYHWERGTKYKNEYFHITSYSWDQVYNGYGQEQRAPRLTESVKATHGRVVTYAGKTAITPYFSRSDGRTRDWSEVWYGSVDWLKSVPAPCDKAKGLPLWGHGVGMSASEALCMANNGDKWDEILHYFYQGVDINRHW